MEQTLILNATYEPLKVVDWQRAITLWCQPSLDFAELRLGWPSGPVTLASRGHAKAVAP